MERDIPILSALLFVAGIAAGSVSRRGLRRGHSRAHARPRGRRDERGRQLPPQYWDGRNLSVSNRGTFEGPNHLGEHGQPTSNRPLAGAAVTQVLPLVGLVLLQVLGLFFLCLPALHAQQQFYATQKAIKVELITRPGLDTNKLRQLLVQKAGENYSEAQVQATVAALMRTGKFDKVDLKVEPEVAGLRVTFICQPIFYVGLMSFPGADKEFSYSQLLQVVNYSSEEPFQESTIPQAEAALLELFKRNGFFQATVNTQTHLDEAHRLADLVFNVDLKKQAKFGHIEAEGAPPPVANKLLGAAGSLIPTIKGDAMKSGKPYTPKRIEAGIEYMQKKAGDMGHLASQIELSSTDFDPERNRADVVFLVTLGPQVSIRIEGAHLSWIPFLAHRRKRRLIPIYEENAVDQDLIEEGEANLKTFFQRHGYFDVKVDDHVQKSPAEIGVTYDVEKGKRHRVAGVSIRGGRALDTDDLIDQLSVQPSKFLSRGRFSDQLVTQSAQTLKAIYQNAGFEEVSVEPRVTVRETNLYVAFLVTEGSRTFVNSVKVEGNKSVALRQLPLQGFKLRAGSPFSREGLSSDRNSLEASYLDLGYLQATVTSKVSRLPNNRYRVDVVHVIHEGPLAHIADVLTLGATHTRQSLILKTARINKGTPLSFRRLLQAESNLYDLGIFDWVSVDPAYPISDQTSEPVLIRVHEARKNTISYGFGIQYAHKGGNIPGGTVALPGLPPIFVGKSIYVSSEAGIWSPRGTFEYRRRNLFGRAETASIGALIGRLDQRGLFTFGDPHLFGGRWSGLLSLSAERNSENPIFTARLGDASFQIEKPLSRTQTALFRYSFSRTTLTNLLIPELVLPEDRNVTLTTLSASWVHDTRDQPLDAHQGLYQTADLGMSPQVLGSSAGFARFFGQMAYYQPFFNKALVWANDVRLGLAKAFPASRVPLSERFFSGGSTSLRGFPINGAGPQRTVPVCGNPSDPSTCSKIQVPVGGTQLFIVNSELRFPMPITKGLGGAVFYDGGNVYDHIGFRGVIANFSNTLGVGLRYQTPVGPIRFDVGHLMSPIPGINPTQFFITIGQAF